MADLVVTVPKSLWSVWLLEGDTAGAVRGSENSPEFKAYEDADGMLEWHFYLSRLKPPISPGERVYVVAHGRLRGFSPLVRVEQDRGSGRYALVRHHGARAVTIDDPIQGFQGFRKRWWDQSLEREFPGWKTEGVRDERKVRWER